MSERIEPTRVGEVDFFVPASQIQQKALLLPNWINQESFQALKKYGGFSQYLCLSVVGAPYDSSCLKIAESAQQHLTLSQQDSSSALLADQIKSALQEGLMVICLPVSTEALPGIACRQPAQYLSLVSQLQVPQQVLFVQEKAHWRLRVENPRAEASLALWAGPVHQPIDSVSQKFSGASCATRLPALQQDYFQGSEIVFSSKPILHAHLAQLLLRGILRHSKQGKIIDGFDGSETSYLQVLSAALAMASRLRKETSQKRIGIVLPPGRGALIANLAVVFANKIPVNLNFSASRDAIESAIRRSEIDRMITADPFVRRQPTFPWLANKKLVLMERLLPKLKARIVINLALCKVLPAFLLSKIYGLPSKGGKEEAALLFTSGSSGEPKGVVLSHSNLIANVTQFSTRLALEPGDKIMGTLPLFHSFGFTVTLWYPLLEGYSLVTYPTPLETVKISELIHQHRAALLLATPTFLRGYFRRVKKEHMAPLKHVVAGAEKLPEKLRQSFLKKFGLPIMEGYGLTETSPVTNCNMPSPLSAEEGGKGQQNLAGIEGMAGNIDSAIQIPSAREGSVGQLLAGIAIRIRHPDSGEDLPIDQSGVIWLKGANIFRGYLGDPDRSKEVLQDRWLRTGDVGRIDDDGFLYIEGRLSRFSKIAGEMVPHETVEEYINQAMGLESDDQRAIAIVGVPDEKKGEALVLLSTVSGETLNQEIIDLRYTLLDLGMPSLWTPKQIVPVEEIPALASGKLDLKLCQDLALKAVLPQVTYTS